MVVAGFGASLQGRGGQVWFAPLEGMERSASLSHGDAKAVAQGIRPAERTERGTGHSFLSGAQKLGGPKPNDFKTSIQRLEVEAIMPGPGWGPQSTS